MSNVLQPFLISEFQTGLSTFLQPWMRPRDAFEPLTDAYTYRGVVTKRNGSVPFGNQLADHKPVMGIMNWIDESTGNITLIVASTKALYKYDPGSNTFTALTAVVSSAFFMGTVTGTMILPTFFPNVVPASVSITDGTNTLTFNAAGMQNSAPAGIFGAGSTFNYTTGVATIVFTGSTMGVTLKITETLVTPTPSTGGYFTGNNTNFFNWTNWQASVGAPSYLYVTNNIDPVTLFDGTNLSRPVFYIDSSGSQYIKTTLDVNVYQNRLLMIRPTIFTVMGGTSAPANQQIAFSALFNPFDFIADIAGHGGQVTAPTGDIIQSEEFLRNTMIVFFTTSVWNFRFTGSFSDPFRFDKLTVAKSTSSPYASVAYDERCTSIGNLGLIACDGVNVQRYDTSIIDYYETQISEQYFSQNFSQRYDNLNQTWMFYVSNGTLNPVVGTGAPGSDQALIYNFAEQSWATYTFPFPMTCMGKYFSQKGTTWADLPVPWETQDSPWKSYTSQKLAPILLGGDVNGNVYWMDNEDAVSDDEVDIVGEVLATGDGTTTTFSGTVADPPLLTGTFTATDGVETFRDIRGNGFLTGSLGGNGSIIYSGVGAGNYLLVFKTAPANLASITANYIHGYTIKPDLATTRWNPLMQAGKKLQFPYIDIYYSVASTDPLDPIQLTLKFYVSNRESVSLQRTLTLDGPTQSNFTFKRVYMNLIGEFLKMEIDPSVDANFQILGFILWARPAGRLTPP